MKLDSDGRRVQDTILRYILTNFASAGKDTKKLYSHHLTNVANALIKMMRLNEFFSATYQRMHPAGSYWDGIKVGLPEEFDINLIYKLPFTKQECTINYAAPAYVIINVQNGLNRVKSINSYRKIIDKWIDPEGNIVAENVRSWQESNLEKAMFNLETDLKGNRILTAEDGQKYLIKHKKAGPAFTVHVIEKTCGTYFDVDLVPAFQFSEELRPDFIRPCPGDANGKSWFVVPKPYEERQAKIKVEPVKVPLCWRLSFHDNESFLLRDTLHLKPTIKFLKKFRDAKELHLLHSYAIKTLFLWEINNEQGKDFWKQELSFLFLKMFDTLKTFINNGNIPFFWDKEHNLLNLTQIQKENISNNINNSYERIWNGLQSDDIFVIAKELCTEDELKDLQKNVKIYHENGKLLATYSATRH